MWDTSHGDSGLEKGRGSGRVHPNAGGLEFCRHTVFLELGLEIRES